MNFDPKVTEIKPGPRDQLSISLDYDDNPSLQYPVLLVIPDVSCPEHSHIKLSREQATLLRDWLNEYLGEQ